MGDAGGGLSAGEVTTGVAGAGRVTWMVAVWSEIGACSVVLIGMPKISQPKLTAAKIRLANTRGANILGFIGLSAIYQGGLLTKANATAAQDTIQHRETMPITTIKAIATLLPESSGSCAGFKGF
jgi:hypothetical protein